ncbi:hypothetical protein HanIR_Chr10g0492651 [Helianthus annuus]|nr:hypothetical protein HanIR_Chr10g0492651 [Helianthus annuus]
MTPLLLATNATKTNRRNYDPTKAAQPRTPHNNHGSPILHNITNLPGHHHISHPAPYPTQPNNNSHSSPHQAHLARPKLVIENSADNLLMNLLRRSVLLAVTTMSSTYRRRSDDRSKRQYSCGGSNLA